MNTVDENIYNLLKQPSQCSTSHIKPYYRSIFSNHGLQSLNKKDNSHRTMGLTIVPKPDPLHPLRRREKYVELPKITPLLRIHRMPPIPKETNRNCYQLKPRKNFIRENINQIIQSIPTCPRRFIVSDRKGNKFLIDGSGLQKDFIYKKNYGQIPSYLQAMKTCKQSLPCPFEENSPKLLSEEERRCLIDNLKNRYQEALAEYQRLPLRIETSCNKMKEASLTKVLIELEHEIDFLEKHEKIFIADPCSEIPN